MTKTFAIGQQVVWTDLDSETLISTGIVTAINPDEDDLSITIKLDHNGEEVDVSPNELHPTNSTRNPREIDMAQKTELIGECTIHGEFFMDALDSPCPSCDEPPLDTFEVTIKVRMKVDAPSRDEAERYAATFVEDALHLLFKEGCDPGDGFNEATSVAYEESVGGLFPIVHVALS